jgi:ubiquinone/menaquinone biosynthesis C-methylase UbiE
VRVVEEGAEALSLDSGMADTVVVTYALCSIPEPERAVGEFRRILKPGGRLLFCEHGRARSDGARRWQTRIEPAWKRLGLGCHLTREPNKLLSDGGFRIEMIEEGTPRGMPETLDYHYIGAAHPA